MEPLLIPTDLVAMELEIPDDTAIGAHVEPSQFPPGDWQQYPAPEWQAELGDMWAQDGTFLWLAVPSAIVPQEYNILLNPRHPRMSDIKVVASRSFSLDKRLL